MIETNKVYNKKEMNRDRSVGIATRYGMDGPVIESRWEGEISHTRPVRSWGPPSLSYNRYRVFPWAKAVRPWCWQPTQSLAGFKEEYGYTLLLLWDFVASSRVKFTFYKRKEMFHYKIWALKHVRFFKQWKES